MRVWQRVWLKVAARLGSAPLGGPLGTAFLLLALACGTPGAPPPSPRPPGAAQVEVLPQSALPAHVLSTRAYIRQHGQPPPGFVGGRVFGNYEGALPRYDTRRKRIAYREWDVHPRAEGTRRGVERLVTGNDGRAWYTADHYRTFTEVP